MHSLPFSVVRLGRTNRSRTGDAEDQSQSTEATHDRSTSSLQGLFQLSEIQVRQYPDASSYCRFLEICFEPLLAAEYDTVWSFVRNNRRPSLAVECWPLFDIICATIRTMDKGSSIEDVCAALCTPTPGDNRPGLLGAPARDPCFVAIFSILCWTTMTLQPKLHWPDFQGSPSLMVHSQASGQESLRIEWVKRPIPALFRHFHRTMRTSCWRHPIGESKTDRSIALELSCLNYESLSGIAKISLVWVSDLTSHLDFDVTRRQLSIFRFPSFCALSTAVKNEAQSIPILEELVRELYGTTADAARESHDRAQLHREILMSYRLLFGQRRGSRQLAKVALKTLKDKEGDKYDDLLDLLCTHRCDSKIRSLPVSLWPVTCRTFEGDLQEENSYSSQDDFPLFGQRLVKLQEFTLRQQPSKLGDLWRDKRNPLQWYTFWAVLIVGGASILIGLLQLFIGTAQLVVTLFPQNSGCRC
ncbi:hypothetical protein F5Y13DRAFT_115086 [Hypoxylon sp. FL1857]|nr:hypothetical protein F5Y13DRAFT_115086 [Hypoxylon sp. FL1857]